LALAWYQHGPGAPCSDTIHWCSKTTFLVVYAFFSFSKKDFSNYIKNWKKLVRIIQKNLEAKMLKIPNSKLWTKYILKDLYRDYC
jgi:hypothetical protein